MKSVSLCELRIQATGRAMAEKVNSEVGDWKTKPQQIKDEHWDQI